MGSAGNRPSGNSSEEEVLQAALHDAAISGDDAQMLGVIEALFEWDGCRNSVAAWLSRLPEASRGDTVVLLAKTIKLNALGLAEAEHLEAELRWMYFITAYCSQDRRVMAALSRGGGNQLAARKTSGT